MIYSFKDKREQTPDGEKIDNTLFIGRMKSDTIAKIMKEHIFPKSGVPYVVEVVLTSDGYFATKLFVQGLHNTHAETLEFKDFEIKGRLANIVKPHFEKAKKVEFGVKYIIAKEQIDGAEQAK